MLQWHFCCAHCLIELIVDENNYVQRCDEHPNGQIMLTIIDDAIIDNTEQMDNNNGI